MNGYAALAELLRRAEVRVASAMVGGSNVAWLAHAVAHGFRFVRVRHEETAVHAATGFARSTGTVGVCSVTRGPGFTNALTALTAAARGHAPIVVVTGEAPSSNPVQAFDQRAVASAAGAGYHHVPDGEDLEQVFWDCFGSARRESRPQVLGLAEGVAHADVQLTGGIPRWRDLPLEPAPAEVSDAVGLLVRAERPLVLAGGGTLQANADDRIRSLARAIGAHGATTLNANRYFSGYAADLGLCGGWADSLTRDVMARSDVVLSLGASLNRHTLAGGVLDGAELIQCDVDRSMRHPRAAVFLHGDAGATAARLLDRWHASGQAARPCPDTPSWPQLRESVLSAELDHDPARGIDIRRLYAALDNMLAHDRIVITDHGRFVSSAPSLLHARDARSWLAGANFGAVGLGLGTAIGAAAANNPRPVVLAIGDGGFAMSVHALDAVRMNNLDLTVVVVNDEMYGADAKYLTPYGLPTDVIRQSLPDIPLIARAFGGTGHVIEDAAELHDIPLTFKGLEIVDARVDPMTNYRGPQPASSAG